MKFKRDTKEYQEEQERIMKNLVQEAVTGETKMDSLDNSGRSFFCPEAEAMYFSEVRNFLENSISKKVMTRNNMKMTLKIER